jgi:hypothetical protein
MELPFAALHQLCGPMLDRLDRLPGPQRDALGVAFGLRPGSAPDRFLVGLAVLSLLSEVAADQPLLCLVDDAQWLDQASAQALAFVARRLDAESVALLFATRDRAGEGHLAGLPGLAVAGLTNADAQALLASVLPGRLDERVRDRIIAESGGNPLALLELPRAVTATELAGGFGLLLDGLALLNTDGYTAAAPTLKRALSAFSSEPSSRYEAVRWLSLASTAAIRLWDDESWDVLSTRHVQLARDAGALGVLPVALSQRAGLHLHEGDFAAAASVIEEARAITEATGSELPPYASVALAAFRGRQLQTSELIEATCSTGNGSAARTAASTRASNYAPRTRCSPSWEPTGSRNEPRASCVPPASASANAAPMCPPVHCPGDPDRPAGR